MSSPDDVKYIRITDFDDEGIVLGNNFTTCETIEPEYRLEDGDMLFARSGATAGKTFIYESSLGSAVFAGYCIRFKFDMSRILPSFAYYCTKTTRYGRWVLSIQRPSGQPNINKEEFKSFEIPLPPLDVQRALVSKMESARASRKAKLAKADALLAGLDAFLLDQLGLTAKKKTYPFVFAARLGNAGKRCDADFHSPRFRELREAIENCGHTVMKLKDMRKSMKTGFAAGREVQAFDDATGIPHIRPLNITPFGELTFAGTKRVPKANVPPQEIIQQGEVLLNNTNSTAWVGKTAVFEDQRLCCCSNHITRIVPKDGVIPWFLASLLNAIRSTGYLGLLATNFVNQAGINTATLDSLRLPIPDKHIQQTIVDELHRRRMEARHLREEAGREWEAAKARFEAQLLGEETTT